MLNILKTRDPKTVNSINKQTLIHKDTILLFSVVICSSIFRVRGEVDQLLINAFTYRTSV